MWSITPSSFITLRERFVGGFRDRLVDALRTAFPDRTAKATGHELKRIADRAIGQAGEYEFKTERQIWALCAAMYVFGTEFVAGAPHRHWAPGLMADDDLATNDKVRLLVLRVAMETGVKVA
jgi:hypothetical protein